MSRTPPLSLAASRVANRFAMLIAISTCGLVFSRSARAETGPSTLEMIEELETEIASMPRVHEIDTATTVRLDVHDIVGSVDMSYPELIALGAQLEAADGEQFSARGIFDPKLKLGVKSTPAGFYDTLRIDAALEQLLPIWGTRVYAGYRLADGNLPVYYLEDETLGGGELRAGARIPLLKGGSIDASRAKLALAEWNLRMTEEEREAQRIAFRRIAVNAFWDWVAAVERFRIKRELLRLAEARDSQVARRVVQGAVPAIERLENLRAILSRREGLIKAERGVEKSAIKLSMFLRDIDGRPVRPNPASAPRLRIGPQSVAVRFEAGLERARTRRPEIRRADHAVRRAGVSLKLARNDRLPNLDVLAEVSKDLGAGNAEQEKALAPTTVKLGLSISAPLLLREGRGKARSAEAKQRALHTKADFVRDKVEAEVHDVRSRLTTAARGVRTNRLSLRAAKTAARAELRRFELGASSLLVVNLREQVAATAAVKWVEASRDLAITRFDWRAVTMAD